MEISNASLLSMRVIILMKTLTSLIEHISRKAEKKSNTHNIALQQNG